MVWRNKLIVVIPLELHWKIIWSEVFLFTDHEQKKCQHLNIVHTVKFLDTPHAKMICSIIKVFFDVFQKCLITSHHQISEIFFTVIAHIQGSTNFNSWGIWWATVMASVFENIFNCCDVRPAPFKTNFSRKDITCNGCAIFNGIPLTIRRKPLRSFKIYLRKYLIQCVPKLLSGDIWSLQKLN